MQFSPFLYAFYPHGESYKNVWNTNPTQQMSNEGTKHSETENFSLQDDFWGRSFSGSAHTMFAFEVCSLRCVFPFRANKVWLWASSFTLNLLGLRKFRSIWISERRRRALCLLFFKFYERTTRAFTHDPFLLYTQSLCIDF